ncbi:hypothetical protein AQUCO_06200016v1 [Aquilegia coerulea]|uniref:Uncharacterized protein n=1 Tax=Aquilegia coerulea TaxID=218851 RepID=A0A2G5CCY4_AQUCA|nr:hypothetical protein AQUCO_06200016v1 [Aquilegia coerulea]
MEADRLNCPHTSAIKLEVLGFELQFSQDPNSKHLGTTVWDASMVFVKYLERNCRKGRFCPSKLKGKRVIELGAGCGVAGFDQVEVLPLLMRNVERNTSRITQSNLDSGSFGSIQVAELDWGNQEHIKAVGSPFDYIIGTDVVYAEHLLDPLLQTMFSLSGPKTTILLGYEIRNTIVHEQMLSMWKNNFELKTVPRTKMDNKYQHESIHLYIMESKNRWGCSEIGTTAHEQQNEELESMEKHENTDEGESCHGAEELEDRGGKEAHEVDSRVGISNGDLSDWQARRYGSMAARLLCDIKIT